MRVRRVSGAAAAAIVSIVVVFASMAWACVEAKRASVQATPDQAAAGTEVLLNGVYWAADVEVRIGWSSDQYTVPRELARVKTDVRGAFSDVPVTIPDAAPGEYLLVVSQDGARASTAFTVTGATAAQPTSDSAPAGSATGSGARYPSRSSQPSPSGTEPEPSPATSSAAQPGPSGRPSANTTSEAPAGTVAGAPAAEVAASEPAAAANPVPAVERAASPRRTTAADGAVGSASSGAPALAPSEEERTKNAPAVAMGRSAFADTWPGFEPGSSFVPSITRPEPVAAGSSSGAALALLAVTVGLMALASGFGFAEAARRRSLAHHGATR